MNVLVTTFLLLSLAIAARSTDVEVNVDAAPEPAQFTAQSRSNAMEQVAGILGLVGEAFLRSTAEGNEKNARDALKDAAAAIGGGRRKKGSKKQAKKQTKAQKRMMDRFVNDLVPIHDARNGTAASPAHVAAYNGRAALLDRLLQGIVHPRAPKANPNAVDGAGRSVVRWAILGHCSAGSFGAGNLDKFRRVAPAEVTPVAAAGGAVKVEGAARGGAQWRTARAVSVLRSPPDLLRAAEAARRDGREGPHAAAVRALLEAGAEALGEDLYQAITCGWIEGATLLLAAGADRGAYRVGRPALVAAVAQLDVFEMVLTRTLLERPAIAPNAGAPPATAAERKAEADAYDAMVAAGGGGGGGGGVVVLPVQDVAAVARHHGIALPPAMLGRDRYTRAEVRALATPPVARLVALLVSGDGDLDFDRTLRATHEALVRGAAGAAVRARMGRRWAGTGNEDYGRQPLGWKKGEALDVDERDFVTGRTALARAAAAGSAPLARLLCEAGADVAARDADGNTPRDLARFGGHDDVAALLRRYEFGDDDDDGDGGAEEDGSEAGAGGCAVAEVAPADLSPAAFLRDYVARGAPVVVRGGARHLPALAALANASNASGAAEYFLEHAPDLTVSPFYPSRVDSAAFGRVSLGAFLQNRSATAAASEDGSVPWSVHEKVPVAALSPRLVRDLAGFRLPRMLTSATAAENAALGVAAKKKKKKKKGGKKQVFIDGDEDDPSPCAKDDKACWREWKHRKGPEPQRVALGFDDPTEWGTEKDQPAKKTKDKKKPAKTKKRSKKKKAKKKKKKKKVKKKAEKPPKDPGIFEWRNDEVVLHAGGPRSGAPHTHTSGEAAHILLAGAQRWLLYRPARAAASRVAAHAAHDAAAAGKEDDDASCAVLLSAGDVLFIPSGWGHVAVDEEPATFGFSRHLKRTMDSFRKKRGKKTKKK